MSVFKKFKSSDIFIIPFETNKGFYFYDISSSFSSSGIFKFEGKNEPIDFFNPSYSLTTNSYPKKNIYDSVKQLYYSNHIQSTYDDNPNRLIQIPSSDGLTFELVGSQSSQGRYDNFDQSDLTYPIYFPTGTNDIIGVLSIPQSLYGDYIKPGSFKYYFPSESIFDDGEGNVYRTSTNQIVGRIIYSHGIITITSDGESTSIYGSSLYGISLYSQSSSGVSSSIYGGNLYGISLYGQSSSSSLFINNFLNLDGEIYFSSSLTSYQCQYNCNIKENEFNYSYNKSLIADTGSYEVKSFVNDEYFNVYATTIGLYNDNQELLAVAKLAQPIRLSKDFETNFIINIDK